MIDEALRALSGQFGVLAGFIFIVVTGAMGKWVFGHIHNSALADKDKQIVAAEARATRWEQIALKALNVGEKVVGKGASDEGAD